MRERDDEFSGSWWRYALLRNALVAGGLTGVAYMLGHVGGIVPERIERGIYLVAIPLAAYHWVREAIEDLVREAAIGIDLLMLAALVGSCALGLWDEGALLAVLYGAAEGLEDYTYARTRSAIRALLDLAPKQARVLRDGRESVIPAEELQPGDRFVVRPGEGIPTDGVIRNGRSSIDESAVTGESIPVDKAVDDPVFAGTLNRQGALEVEVTAAFADNTLAKIIHLVERAQTRKGKAQQWIERFGRRYSPAVLAAAACLLVVPWLGGLAFAAWAYRAVVLLVAAAPCALVMSMPVAMAAGIGHAGKRGVLIKGGVHLEHLGRIRAVAFDKTGTLTEGRPAVTDVVALRGTEHDVLAVAAGVEHFSEHPLAEAIVDYARSQGIRSEAEVRGFEALTGAGAKAAVGGTTWLVGSATLFRDMGADLGSIQSRLDVLQEEGKTVVLIGNRGGIIGLIALRDRIRPGAAALINALRAEGAHVVMLTGDNQRTANAVAQMAGIQDVRAGLTPDEKVTAVRQLEDAFGSVLMIGDGVNDAPALAAATCGMAMGAAGSDAAIEAADVALMGDDLEKLSEALHLGRRVRAISRQNIVFSIVVLAVLIPAALSGVLSVAIAVLAHELSELVAVANGLRAAT